MLYSPRVWAFARNAVLKTPMFALGAAAALGLSISPACDNVGVASVATIQTDEAHHGAPRIAALLPFAADQLLEIGVTPVGVPKLRGEMPSTWDSIPAITIDHSAGPNLEELLSVDPDIIITSSVYAQFLPMIEESTGARVIVMDVDSLQQVPAHITTLGELSERTEQAGILVQSINSLLTKDEESTEDLSVLAIFGTPHAFYAFLPDSYLGDLIELAGGTLITHDMQSHSVFRGLAPLSMEAVIARNPDHLIVIFHGPGESARAMLDHNPIWSELTAVREDSVSFLRDDLYAMRPGSEMRSAMNEISEIITAARGNTE